MHTTTGDERRGATRVPVELWVEERTGDALYFQRATSLSLGGVYLDRTLPHPPGTEVVLDLALPGAEEPMRLKGEVVTSSGRDEGMGVRFVGLDADDRLRLAEYLFGGARPRAAMRLAPPRRSE